MSKIYGYVRCSTKKQIPDRQIRNIVRDFPNANLIIESFTGTKMDRPEWNKLYKKLQSGDTIVFDEVSRMSRNAEEGFAMYQELTDKGINLVFLKEPYMNTESYKESMKGVLDVQVSSGDNATDQLINAIMSAINTFMFNKIESDIRNAFEVAQKEVDYLHQRTKEGLETARLNGKHIGIEQGTKLITKKSLAAKEKIKKYNKDFGGSLNNEDTWTLIGISKMSFYKYKKELLEELA